MLPRIAGKKAKEVAAKIGPLLRHNSERLLGLASRERESFCWKWEA
jgi:hypothetical protein